MAGQQHEVTESNVSKKARYIWRGCIHILRPILKSNFRPQAYHCSTQLQPSTEQESLSTLISKQGKLISQSIHITLTPNPLSSDVSTFFYLSLSPFPFPLYTSHPPLSSFTLYSHPKPHRPIILALITRIKPSLISSCGNKLSSEMMYWW